MKRHGLTNRQRRFVDAYLANGLNASEAIRAIGYKGQNADVNGPRMLGNAGIKKAISDRLSKIGDAEFDSIKHRVLIELQKEAFESETVVTLKQVNGENTYEVERYNPAKMKALELLMKYAGLIVDKKEIKGSLDHKHEVTPLVFEVVVPDAKS